MSATWPLRSPLLRVSHLLLATTALGLATASAPVARAQTGLLVVAHGAGAEWNGLVRETVVQVNWDGPVATAFLMGPEAATAGFGEAVRTLVDRGVRDIVVVPLMVSSHGSHYRQIRYCAGELDDLPPELREHHHGPRPDRPVPMRVTPALDDAPELRQALAAAWASLDEVSRARPLLLVAHGPNDDDDAARWIENVDRALASVAAAPVVRVGLMRDDAPAAVRAGAVAGMRQTIVDLAAGGKDSVTVLPLLISTGRMTAVTIPADLEGLPIRYLPRALAPSPFLAQWIARMGREGVRPAAASR